jgi:hypothetical protein
MLIDRPSRNAAMSDTRLGKWLRGMREFGPYLLIELLLPGGTLVALLLWLMQRVKRVGFGGLLRPRSAATYVNAVVPEPTVPVANSQLTTANVILTV